MVTHSSLLQHSQQLIPKILPELVAVESELLEIEYESVAVESELVSIEPITVYHFTVVYPRICVSTELRIMMVSFFS